MDEEIRERFKVLLEGQIRTDKSVNELAVTMTRYVDSADVRMTRMEDNMVRIEENLDGLIRAITREHGNGRPK